MTPSPLTDAELTAWQELCGKATPGPWKPLQTREDGMSLYGRRRRLVMSLNSGLALPPEDSDAAFIAASNPLTVANLLAEVLALRQRVTTLEVEKRDVLDAAEMLWVVVANVSSSNWNLQTQQWRDAAARWRDNYFRVGGQPCEHPGPLLTVEQIEAALLSTSVHLDHEEGWTHTAIHELAEQFYAALTEPRT